jgi:fatty acid desaturase
MLIETSWIYRRTMVFAIVAVGLAALIYLTARASDAASISLIAGVWQTLILAVALGYLFGAGWDDLNRMRHGRIDAPPPPPPPGEGDQEER